MMRAECLVRTSIPDHPWPAVINESQENGKKEFPCPLCAYTTPYRHRYMEHLSTHYSDKCTLCDFSGQSAQDLRNHLQDVHNISDIEDLSDPQDNNSDYQDDDETPNKRGKSKSFKCKQCNYVTTTKLDFWEHSKGHIKAEKLLTCPKCPFVTEYKHHLEYHLRNHFGSKPFKCTKCSYSCVNKSMLNSHLKSHSNVYQYRCSDCAYATKYCHSLKLHLRKYQHKPAMVLNADGSPNPLPIIDVYGTRRGPKQKTIKSEDSDDKSIFLDIRVPTTDKDIPNLPGGVVVPNAPQISPQSPNSMFFLNNNDLKEETQNGVGPKFYYCTICDFHTIAPEILQQHVFLHAAETNLAHILKTNNNLQDSNVMKDYFQNVYNQTDQTPFIDTRSNSPLSLVSPKLSSPDSKQIASPLDLSKQDTCESENDTSQEDKQTEKTDQKKESDTNKNSSTKHRRKGKAYKLERVNDRLDSNAEDFNSTTTVKVKQEQQPENGKELHCCGYCDIAFKDIIMYTMHMGYHGYQDPFTCNMCGHITLDKVSFFLHIARSSHS
ncbi:hypothetical protein RUM43_000876 [Polyplax serrata]|uniref:Protein hunchback n=1 Tax=Polyplax serrata TaxID=468196 RepID=A0AAN8SE15_POLSC